MVGLKYLYWTTYPLLSHYDFKMKRGPLFYTKIFLFLLFHLQGPCRRSLNKVCSCSILSLQLRSLRWFSLSSSPPFPVALLLSLLRNGPFPKNPLPPLHPTDRPTDYWRRPLTRTSACAGHRVSKEEEGNYRSS